MFFHNYPYTDAHELNLDWILRKIRECEIRITDFINLNTIKYADPILWDITRQYEANTVVVDGYSGNAYISTRPVPAGVSLSRTEYWTQIYNYADEMNTLRDQIAHNEGASSTATQAYNVKDLVFVNGLLYRVISPMIAGDAFVEGSNISKTTIEAEIQSVFYVLYAMIGDLSNLNTTDKSSVVNAINEVLSSLTSAIGYVEGLIGTLANLNTTDKSSVVNAINEVLAALTSASSYLEGRIDSELEPKLKYRKFLAVGDSYGDEAGEWASLVPSNLGIDASNWHNLCVGGAGFISDGVLLFINQITGYSGDRDEITDIIVCGGLNDSFSSNVSDAWWTTLESNMSSFDAYVKANYPNAKVSLGYVGNGVDYDVNSLIGGRVYACRQMCKYFYNNIAAKLGWTMLHNVDLALCPNKDNMSSDGVHPSVFGSDVLAKAIGQAILNGTAEIRYPEFEATNGDSSIKYSVVNDITVLHFKNYVRTIANGVSVPASDTYQTFDNIYFNYDVEVPCLVRFDGFDSLSYQFYPGRIKLHADSMYIEVNGTDGSGNFISSHTATDSSGYIHIVDVDIPIKTEYLA